MADRLSEFADRISRLAQRAHARGLDALVLSEPANLAWLLECRAHVPQTLDTACLDAVLDCTAPAGELRIVTNAIEAPRLRDTELGELPVQWDIVPWWESRDSRLPSGPQVGSDRARPDCEPFAAEITSQRRILSLRQESLLADVCADAAAAATRAAGHLQPAMSEYTAAGLFAAELMAADLDPIVLMVAGSDRGGRHRHPLPTNAPLGARAMLVCCARRHGFVASVTRHVSFGPLEAPLAQAYRRLLTVEQAFLDASLPGTSLGAAFAAGVAAYEQQGFDAEEWHHHHQGGLSGFAPREFPAHHDSTVTLADGMVLAWNPSAATVKVEDTAIVHSGGPRLLVHDPAWPSIDVGDRSRPDILTR